MNYWIEPLIFDWIDYTGQQKNSSWNCQIRKIVFFWQKFVLFWSLQENELCHRLTSYLFHLMYFTMMHFVQISLNYANTVIFTINWKKKLPKNVKPLKWRYQKRNQKLEPIEKNQGDFRIQHNHMFINQLTILRHNLSAIQVDFFYERNIIIWVKELDRNQN